MSLATHSRRAALSTNRHLEIGRRDAVYLIIILLALLILVPILIQEKQANENTSNTLDLILSPPEGYYHRDLLLTIELPYPEAVIRYTLDGSTPSETNGESFCKPIRLSTEQPAVTVLRARYQLPNGDLGPVVSATYVVGLEAELPLLSLIIDPADYVDPEQGIYTNPEMRGMEWERPVEAVYFDAAKSSQARPVSFHVPAGIRIHGAASRGYEKKSLRLYFRQEYNFNRLEYPLFGSSGLEENPTPSSFKRLVVRDGGQDFGRYGWTLMRTHLVNNLAQAIGSFTPRSQPVLLFVNGQPQGVYLVQERIDERFFADRYGIETTSFDQGDRTKWFNFLDYLETADLTEPATYAYAQSQLDMSNYMDYYALQLYSVSTDWVSPNTRNFRPDTHGGRWHGLFWDVDWTFGLVVWGGYDFNMLDWLQYQDRPDLERGSLLFRRLLENSDFRASFLSRTADLLNTVLAPEQVLAQIDMLTAELRPDIHYEVGRWPSSSDWENNVQRMREFVLHRPDFFRQQLVDYFELNGITELSFLPPAEGRGTLAVNETLLPNEPWQGIYFRGSELDIVAVPAPGYRFAGWNRADLPTTSQISLPVADPITISPRFEPVSQNQLRPGDVEITHIWPEGNGPNDANIELLVTRPGGIDLRNWRITDNDTITATDEGSLIFPDEETFAHIAAGTTILIATKPCANGGKACPLDDLSGTDGQLFLHSGNHLALSETDPWFKLSQNDSVALLAPGPTAAFDDDRGIAFATVRPKQPPAVTPATFGILADGVTTGMPTIPR